MPPAEARAKHVAHPGNLDRSHGLVEALPATDTPAWGEKPSVGARTARGGRPVDRMAHDQAVYDDRLCLLSEVDVFAGRTTDEMQAIAAAASMRTYAPGETLYTPRRPVEALFILKRRRVRLPSNVTVPGSTRSSSPGMPDKAAASRWQTAQVRRCAVKACWSSSSSPPRTKAPSSSCIRSSRLSGCVWSVIASPPSRPGLRAERTALKARDFRSRPARCSRVDAGAGVVVPAGGDLDDTTAGGSVHVDEDVARRLQQVRPHAGDLGSLLPGPHGRCLDPARAEDVVQEAIRALFAVCARGPAARALLAKESANDWGVPPLRGIRHCRVSGWAGRAASPSKSPKNDAAANRVGTDHVG